MADVKCQSQVQRRLRLFIEPMELVKRVTNENDRVQYHIDEFTKRILIEKLQDRHFSAVSVVGPYRSGKSRLLNSLINDEADPLKHFPEGDEVEAKTKGIWIAGVVDENDHCMLFLDTEGHGDTGQVGEDSIDDHITALATFISTIFIYNCSGVPRRGQLEDIGRGIILADWLDVMSNLESVTCCKSFILVLRDFALRLSINGQPITHDGYLQRLIETSDANLAHFMDNIFRYRHLVTFTQPKRNEAGDVAPFAEWCEDQIIELIALIRNSSNASGVSRRLISEWLTSLNNAINMINDGGLMDSYVSLEDLAAKTIRKYECHWNDWFYKNVMVSTGQTPSEVKESALSRFLAKPSFVRNDLFQKKLERRVPIYEDCIEQGKSIKGKLIRWLLMVNPTVKNLRETAVVLDLICVYANKVRIAGNVVGIVGAATGIVGGALAIASFGLALPAVLGAVGAVSGIGGAVTAAIARRQNRISSKKELEQAIDRMKDFDTLYKELTTDLRHLTEKCSELDEVPELKVTELKLFFIFNEEIRAANIQFPRLHQIVKCAADIYRDIQDSTATKDEADQLRETLTTAAGLTSGTISGASAGGRAAFVLFDAAADVGSAAKTVFQVAGKAMAGVGIVFGGIGILLDTADIVLASIELAKHGQTEGSKNLRRTAADAEDEAEAFCFVIDAINLHLCDDPRQRDLRQQPFVDVLTQLGNEETMILQSLLSNTRQNSEDFGHLLLNNFLLFAEIAEKLNSRISRFQQDTAELSAVTSYDILLFARSAIAEGAQFGSSLEAHPAIEDVVLHQPWGCALDEASAFGISCNLIKAQTANFVSSENLFVEMPKVFLQATPMSMKNRISLHAKQRSMENYQMLKLDKEMVSFSACNVFEISANARYLNADDVKKLSARLKSFETSGLFAAAEEVNVTSDELKVSICKCNVMRCQAGTVLKFGNRLGLFRQFDLNALTKRTAAMAQGNLIRLDNKYGIIENDTSFFTRKFRWFTKKCQVLELSFRNSSMTVRDLCGLPTQVENILRSEIFDVQIDRVSFEKFDLINKACKTVTVNGQSLIVLDNQLFSVELFDSQKLVNFLAALANGDVMIVNNETVIFQESHEVSISLEPHLVSHSLTQSDVRAVEVKVPMVSKSSLEKNDWLKVCKNLVTLCDVGVPVVSSRMKIIESKILVLRKKDEKVYRWNNRDGFLVKCSVQDMSRQLTGLFEGKLIYTDKSLGLIEDFTHKQYTANSANTADRLSQPTEEVCVSKLKLKENPMSSSDLINALKLFKSTLKHYVHECQMCSSGQIDLTWKTYEEYKDLWGAKVYSKNENELFRLSECNMGELGQQISSISTGNLIYWNKQYGLLDETDKIRLAHLGKQLPVKHDMVQCIEIQEDFARDCDVTALLKLFDLLKSAKLFDLNLVSVSFSDYLMEKVQIEHAETSKCTLLKVSSGNVIFEEIAENSLQQYRTLVRYEGKLGSVKSASLDDLRRLFGSAKTVARCIIPYTVLESDGKYFPPAPLSTVIKAIGAAFTLQNPQATVAIHLIGNLTSNGFWDASRLRKPNDQKRLKLLSDEARMKRTADEQGKDFNLFCESALQFISQFDVPYHLFRIAQNQPTMTTNLRYRTECDFFILAQGSISIPSQTGSHLKDHPGVEDVVIYQPWNCALDISTAYGICTNSLIVHDVQFKDCTECPKPARLRPEYHRWNAMSNALDQKIPLIRLTAIKLKEPDIVKLMSSIYALESENKFIIPYTMLESQRHGDCSMLLSDLCKMIGVMCSSLRLCAKIHLISNLITDNEEMIVSSIRQHRYLSGKKPVMTCTNEELQKRASVNASVFEPFLK